MENFSDLDLAKSFLKKLAEDPMIKADLPVDVLTRLAKQQGIKRAVLKQARKELKISSVQVDGVRMWVMKKA